MKKIFKGLICIGLAGAMAAGTMAVAGCKKDNNPGSGTDEKNRVYRNSERDPLRLAIGAVDQKFNPLYYTSLNDGTIANLTQVSLISADEKGQLAVGEDEPTVALDYLETYYDANGKALAKGDGKTVTALPGGNVSGDQNGYTTYEFLIKNGMKFSDNTDLTVMDVLFNLYVFLDPLYSGSNTIYSTRIRGLQAYRTNTPGAADTVGGSSMNITHYVNATNRYNALYRWADGQASSYVEKDLDKVSELYEDKLNSDWNSIATTYTDVYEDYYFDEAWKAFFFMEGAFGEQKKPNTNGIAVRFKDANGKYPTLIDPKADDEVTEPTGGQVGVVHSDGQVFLDYMADRVSAEKIADFMSKNPGMSEANAKLTLQKQEAIEYLYEANTLDAPGIKKILDDGSFASTVIDAFYQDEISNSVENAGGKKVDRIEGITVSHSNTFNGKTLDEEHDILKIEVVGVDPKAKWNFGFTVSPMHYYSDKAHYDAAMKDYTDGKVYDGTATNFGVEYSNTNFIDNVLSASNKNGLPVGAGPYKCCTYNFSQSGLNAGTFFYNYMAFFERNENFTTMGKGIENAKIKYVTYRVTSDDQIVNALKTGEIDYGEPIATHDNQTATLGMTQKTYQTGGYGYVGINPKYVPDIEVRRAIMMAFDTSHIRQYYGGGLVNVINRPMSNTSWVWDYVKNPETAFYSHLSRPADIIDYIQSNGNWSYVNGNWENSDGRRGLNFTFTIAGESIDHPAYDMFVYAERLLEQAGFSISVETDIRALQKLTTGDLTVWAAAWSSSIDPDPYQIYSIYSNASSTRNWYKDGIMSDATTKYETEREIANALNDKILAGRQTLDEQRRAVIYGQSSASANASHNYAEMCALDLIMELAVEYPTYQRYDLCVYNGNVLDGNSMTAEPTHNMGPISKLWEVSYYTRPANAE